MAISLSMQTGMLQVGDFHRAPIQLRPAFFITAALLAGPFWLMMSPRGLALGVLFVAVMFASILAHELAHAEVGRRYQVPVQGIEINMLGGFVRFSQGPLTRAQSFAITLAGPMANLAIGLVALAMVAIMPHVADVMQMGNQTNPGPPADAFREQLVRATAYLNLGLCAVNLIPAFPLDGGKLLYLLIEKRWSARSATFLVSGLGLVFAAASTLLLVGTLLSGFPIYAPPGFAINWRAFQAARQGVGGWDSLAFA